ncbi:polysaccharide deacetylase family protein [Natrialbaceae archaeon A-CW1-1]
MSDKNLACLTLDLENDWYFDEPEYDHLTLEYIDDYIDLIQELDVPVTFFVVGRTLKRFPEVIDELDANLECDFHLHSYQHDTSKSYNFQTEVQQGVEVFEAHFGHEPDGYRAPQGNIDSNELQILEDEGFVFDSSVFPSYRPGVYSNLDKPLTPYQPEATDDLLEIPISATPRTRIPLSQSYLKILGRPFQTYLRHVTLPPLVVYNSHLQDLYRTESHGQLDQPKRFLFERNLDRSQELFQWSISLLREKGYSFRVMTDIYERYAETNSTVLTHDEELNSESMLESTNVESQSNSQHFTESGKI